MLPYPKFSAINFFTATHPSPSSAFCLFNRSDSKLSRDGDDNPRTSLWPYRTEFQHFLLERRQSVRDEGYRHRC